MKIIFDLRKVGLGNNGGSSTLVKSGNTLVDMGHDVCFVDTMRNQHRWEKLKAEHKIIRQGNKLPSADAIIATGYKSVGPTVTAPEECGVKMHWIRAWETWQLAEDAIIRKVLKPDTIKLVNSICLKEKIDSHGFESHILYPGYDFKDLFPTHKRDENKNIILGGLYREGVHGRRKRTAWLFETARYMKRKYRNVEFWLFGSEQNPRRPIVDKYVRSPSMKEKNDFYNKVDIWMAPTMSEGLHLPPAEALMTECAVVATQAELAGVQDYIIPDQTGLLSPNDLPSFMREVDHLYNHKGCRKRLGKAGRERILEIGDRKKNMEKLVDLIGKLK